MLYASGKGSVSGNIVLKEVCDAVRNINSNQAVWLGIKGRTAISLYIREAELYQKMIASLEDGTCKSVEQMAETERFWNQIMMEHALFIRGLLDPTEGELIETADSFAGDYQRLLEEARQKDCRAMNGPTRKTLETTKKYRDFKAAGTKGITGCEIRSIILPLLADHVLREANHYLRLLKQKGE